MSRIKIALVGRVARGKTMTAFHLQKNRGFQRKKMMDGVTKFVNYMYGYSKKGPKAFISWEHRLEFYDTTYKLDPNIHINYLIRRLEKDEYMSANVVVEDCRYINEVEALRKIGFKIIRLTPSKLTRPKVVGARDASQGLIPVHEWFGRNPDSFPVDYSVTVDTRENTIPSIDRIVDRLIEIV